MSRRCSSMSIRSTRGCRILGIPGDKGIVDVLAGNLELSDVLIQTNIPNLMILPAGRGGPHVPELLSSRQMGVLLAEADAPARGSLHHYRHPALMASSDAAALAPLVGQIVFIVEAHTTQQAEIEAGSACSAPARGSASSSTRAIRWRASILALMGTIIIPLVTRAMSCARPTCVIRRARRIRQWHSVELSFCVAAGITGTPAGPGFRERCRRKRRSSRRRRGRATLQQLVSRCTAAGAGEPAGPSRHRRPTPAGVPGGATGHSPAAAGRRVRFSKPVDSALLRSDNVVPPAASIAPSNALGLTPPGAGVVPLQAYDPNAPAIPVPPLRVVSETFTDNVQLYPLAPQLRRDTPTSQRGLRFGRYPEAPSGATGQANGRLLRAARSNLNQVYGSLYANGSGNGRTGRSVCRFPKLDHTVHYLPGFGFQNLSTLSEQSADTAVYQQHFSLHRKSFDGLVDTRVAVSLWLDQFWREIRPSVTAPLTIPA